jgi:hypothetical protein
MLIRIIGPKFVADAVFDEDERVGKAAPIIKSALGLSPEEMCAELQRRGLNATYVRTLTRAEIRGDDDDDPDP